MNVTVIVSVLLFSVAVHSQFPAICNDQQLLDAKTCCPNDCGGPTRGSCVNITQTVIDQWDNANSSIVELLRRAPETQGKNTADARYRWPIVIFENICSCKGNYGGYNCLECDFGWSGHNCSERKVPVVRKHFDSLSDSEKSDFISATRELKREVGVWSVIVGEPSNYTSGTVTLQNVSTYDMFIFFHDYIARDDSDACVQLNDNITIDFAHEGPAFPVWHRRYMLIVEREFQRIMGNDSFGFPYWQWEEDDRSPFSTEYFGVPSNDFSLTPVDVNGTLFNDWYTICDLTYREPNLNMCAPYWKPCNPANDITAARKLQRGGGSTYLPNRVEVMIAIAAPSYEASNSDGDYLTNNPRASFRNRLEGWNRICSAERCVGVGIPGELHVHNAVHPWVGGLMACVPAAVNDPLFNVHHCNVDRILESWMRRFTSDNVFNSELLPGYVPTRGGHPGHNKNDFMVPFFPLIRAGRQYATAEEWGYSYDNLVKALIKDSTISDCANDLSFCPICDSNSTCIDCTNQTCPAPRIGPIQESLSASGNSLIGVGLGLGFGFGIPLILSVITIAILVVVIFFKQKGKKATSGTGDRYELSVDT